MCVCVCVCVTDGPLDQLTGVEPFKYDVGHCVHFSCSNIRTPTVEWSTPNSL